VKSLKRFLNLEDSYLEPYERNYEKKRRFKLSLSKAEQAMKKKSFEEAAAIYRVLIELDETNRNALFGLAQTYYQRKQYSEAAKYFMKVTEIDQNDMDSWFLLGDSLLHERDYEPARAAIEKGFFLEERETTQSDISKFIPCFQGNAIRCWKRATDLMPDSHDAWNNLGAALSREGEYPEALEALDKALSLEPASVEVIYNKGVWSYRQRRYSRAEEYFHRIIEIQSADDEIQSKAHYNLGLISLKSNRLPRAEKHFNKAIELLPDYGAAYVNLGCLHMKEINNRKGVPERVRAQSLENERKAFECFIQVLRIHRLTNRHPLAGTAFHNLGVLNLRKGDMVLARHYFERAVMSRDDMDSTWKILGQLQETIPDKPGPTSSHNSKIPSTNYEGLITQGIFGSSDYKVNCKYCMTELEKKDMELIDEQLIITCPTCGNEVFMGKFPIILGKFLDFEKLHGVE